nr:protein kinase [Planosporangium thailandense]
MVERLGTGGMSVVWRAYDEVLGRPVAIKVLAAKLAADRDSREMIRTEAKAAARLSHPHVTGVYDYGESTTEDGTTVPYVVMELISGRTLAERLGGGPLPWRAALRVGAEVAAALAAAHAQGLVHRDVKPANVMLTATGAKVVDFGIAAVVGEAGQSEPDGTVLGTPAYLAPERLGGGPVQPASDVYGLGVLLYRALTGAPPWDAETTTQMINAHMYAAPEPLPPITGLPAGIAELCRRCLAKDPADRPSSLDVARTLAAAAGVKVPLPAGADDPDDLVLDPEAPDPVLDALARRGRRRLRRRRALQVVGATAGVATAGLVLATCAELPRGQSSPLAIADRAGTSPAPCAVRYVTRSDSGGRFTVDLTVTNAAPKPLDGWALEFTFTGGQTLVEGSAGQWSESPAGAVTVRSPATGASLAAGASRSLRFSAAYHDSNPMPTAFALNGAACAYVLVGASGETRTGGPGTGSGSDVEADGGGAAPGGRSGRLPADGAVPAGGAAVVDGTVGGVQGPAVRGTPAPGPASGRPGVEPSCSAVAGWPTASHSAGATPDPTPTHSPEPTAAGPTGSPAPTSQSPSAGSTPSH